MQSHLPKGSQKSPIQIPKSKLLSTVYQAIFGRRSWGWLLFSLCWSEFSAANLHASYNEKEFKRNVGAACH